MWPQSNGAEGMPAVLAAVRPTHVISAFCANTTQKKKKKNQVRGEEKEFNELPTSRSGTPKGNIEFSSPRGTCAAKWKVRTGTSLCSKIPS